MASVNNIHLSSSCCTVTHSPPSTRGEGAEIHGSAGAGALAGPIGLALGNGLGTTSLRTLSLARINLSTTSKGRCGLHGHCQVRIEITACAKQRCTIRKSILLPVLTVWPAGARITPSICLSQAEQVAFWKSSGWLLKSAVSIQRPPNLATISAITRNKGRLLTLSRLSPVKK